MTIQRKPNDAIIEYIDSMTSSMVTKLVATGPIPAETTLSVSASGALYTKSGDTGDLNDTAAKFNSDETKMIFLNGVYQIKGVNATWLSATTFKLDVILDVYDEVIIIS